MDINILDKLLGLLQRHGPLSVLLAVAILLAWDERKQRIYLQGKLLKLTAAALVRSKSND